MAVLFANNATALLASGINSSTTTITVAPGKGILYPSPTGGSYFLATLQEGVIVEIVRVTARIGDVMTVMRGQEGTSATTFTVAAVFEGRLTAGGLGVFPQFVNTFSGISIVNGGSISGGTLTFGPADISNPGLVNINAQTFGGLKTFASGFEVANSSASISSSTTVRYRTITGSAQVSSAGFQYRLLFLDKNATEFGVIADRSTDDTVAIQAALDWAKAQIDAQIAVRIIFPAGDMKITSTLVARGNSATAPAFVGAVEAGTAFDLPASRFVWFGADNQPMFYCEAFNRGLLRHLAFDGRDKAGICLWMGAVQWLHPTVLAASDGWFVDTCSFKHVKIQTVGNGCIAVGTDPTTVGGATLQSADGVFRDIDVVGESPGAPGFDVSLMKAYGWKTLAGGNCKNFILDHPNFGFCNIAIDWDQASGFLNVNGLGMADVRQAFQSGAGELNVIGGDIECAEVDDFILLKGSGGAGNAKAFICGIEAFAYMAGTVGTLIDWAGSLTLLNNEFGNQNFSVSGDPAVSNPLKVQIGLAAISQTGSLNSQGNVFRCCPGPYAPFYYAGNPIAPDPDTYGGQNPLHVSSKNDIGSINNSDLIPYANFDSNPTQFFQINLNGPLQVGYLKSGNLGDSAQDIKTILSFDASGGAVVYNSPAAADTNLGRLLFGTKRDTSANTVTINGLALAKKGELGVWVSGRSAAGSPVWENLLAPASSTLSGTITTRAQSFAGDKTFTGNVIVSGNINAGTITASNISGTNTGDITLASVGATPVAAGASLSGQILTLQPADGTHGGVLTAGPAVQPIAGTKSFLGQVGLGGNSTLYGVTIQGTPMNGALVGIQATGCVSGDIGLFMGGPTVTGDFDVLSMGSSATNDSRVTLRNSNSASGSANMALNLISGGASGGDPKIQFTINVIQDWTIGIDNSDSDKFKIAASPNLGVMDVLVLTADTLALESGVKLVVGAGDISVSPGPGTVNEISGRAALDIGATSVVITCSLCAADSKVFVNYEQAVLDVTCKNIRAVPGIGSFTVYADTATTAAVKFSFFIVNQ